MYQYPAIFSFKRGLVNNRIQRIASGQMFSEYLIVTPDKAKSILALMPRNRKINNERVKSLSKIMMSGGWNENHPQGLIFNKSGNLIDGQHRLYAVIESGKAIQFYCTYNADDDCMLHLDSNLPRTVDQTGQILGLNTDKLAISIAKAMFIDVTNSSRKIRGIDTASLLRMFEDYSESINFSKGKRNKGAILFAPLRAMIARAHYNTTISSSFAFGHLENLKRFVEVLDTGFSVSEAEASAIALRNLYLNSKTRNFTSYDGKVRFAAKSVTAIQHFLCGNPTKILREAKVQLFPLKDE